MQARGASPWAWVITSPFPSFPGADPYRNVCAIGNGRTQEFQDPTLTMRLQGKRVPYHDITDFVPGHVVEKERFPLAGSLGQLVLETGPKKPPLHKVPLSQWNCANTSILDTLIQYMDYNDLHDPLQSAYKTAHSTESALLKVQNDILRTFDHGGVVVLVLLDLSAAFDTIDHSILLDRMRHQLGINGVAHAWFESYLTGRTQRIRIGDAWSLVKFLLYCVPQGSVLGPLLFLIYILPLHHLILSHGLQVHGYADDTQVYLSISDPANPDTTRQECTRLESCLTDIHLWMSANKLKLKFLQPHSHQRGWMSCTCVGQTHKQLGCQF